MGGNSVCNREEKRIRFLYIEGRRTRSSGLVMGGEWKGKGLGKWAMRREKERDTGGLRRWEKERNIERWRCGGKRIGVLEACGEGKRPGNGRRRERKGILGACGEGKGNIVLGKMDRALVERGKPRMDWALVARGKECDIGRCGVREGAWCPEDEGEKKTIWNRTDRERTRKA